MKKNENAWFNQSPYERYFDFIAPDADRYEILLERAQTLKLNSVAISVAGNRHIFIFPRGQKSLRSSNGVFPFKGKEPYLLCAHYDRVAGSPGANDNSIAVFHLLKTASILDQKSSGKWIIVFTDKEELSSGESFEEQGSYSMAEKLKSWGLEGAKVFNFDACGTGNVFILSTTTNLILKDAATPNTRRVRENISLLRNHALKTADTLRLDKVLLAPTPFSDDAGFLRAGIAAQTVTMLPANEAAAYENLLRSRPDFGSLLISGKIKTPAEKNNLPVTWRNMNGSLDTPSRLTPEYFEPVVKFMIEICK